MKKKLLAFMLSCTFFLGIAAGCTEQKENDSNENDVQTTKGNCEAEECIKLIEPTMKVEEINTIIGFEGEKKEGSGTYIWQLTDKTKIEVEYKDSLGTITATMDKEKIKNDQLKVSICYAIQNDIKSGTTYTYEEMVEKFEGVEGYLATKAPTFKRFIWVSKDGQTFGATFSDSLNGKCSIVSLR